MALTTVTVTWDENDIGQAPLGGNITFLLSEPVFDSADGIDVRPTPKTYFFASATGTGTSDPLVANDNVSLQPTGSYYTVTVAITGQAPYVFATAISHANGASQTLSFLQANAAVPAATFSAYLPLPSGTPVAGDVPVVQANGSTATAWGAGSVVPSLLIAPAGATAETCERALATATSSASLASGTVYMRSVGLNAGVTVNNITLVTAAANVVTQANLTHGWYALCDSTRHVVAVSTDQTGLAVWTAVSTPYPLPVLGSGAVPYVTTYSGLYYIAEMVAVSAGTMPEFAVSGSILVGPGQLPPVPYGPSSTGQTAPPAIGTQLGAVTFANSNAFYGYTS